MNHYTPRCTCGHAADRHAGISGCLFNRNFDSGHQYDDQAHPEPLNWGMYDVLKSRATCPCTGYQPAQTWRVVQFALAPSGWFDTRPWRSYQIVDPQGKPLNVTVGDHGTAFRVAQALADMDVLRAKRREAMQSGRHPAGRALRAVVDANERLMVAQRHERMAQTNAAVAAVARQAGTIAGAQWATEAEIRDGTPVMDSADTISDKADHYRER